MPTYEYRCEACNHKFEAFQSMSAKPVSVCPKCGKRKVKKLISKGGGLIFKGSGFYLTDYARKGGEAASKEGAAKGEPATPTVETPKAAGQEPGAQATGLKDQSSSRDAAPAKESTPKKESTPAKEPEKASKSAKKK